MSKPRYCRLFLVASDLRLIIEVYRVTYLSYQSIYVMIFPTITSSRSGKLDASHKWNESVQEPYLQSDICNSYNMLQSRATSLLLETLRHSAPVDNIPNSTEVLSLAVLVLQVVSVLPSINAHQRLQVAANGVLVRAGDETEGAGGLVLDQPGPAGALDAGKSGVGLLLEVVEGAEVLLDGSLSRQRRDSISGKYVSLTRSLPSGAPPPPLPLGAKFSQNSEWFT